MALAVLMTAPFVASTAWAKDCGCCKNIEVKLKGAQKGGNNAYFRRKVYFEALKVMGDRQATQMVTNVGRICTPEDKKTARFKALKAQIKGVDAKVTALEKGLGLTLDRRNPFFDAKGRKWCCNWKNPDGSVNQKGTKGAKVSTCVCCKNLSKKISAAERGRGYYWQRKAYFEALKVMDDRRGKDVASSVGRVCTADDKKSKEFKDMARQVRALDKKIRGTEKAAGVTLERSPFFERKGRKWCCNWKTKDGKIVTK
jgi:hypothetical protein